MFRYKPAKETERLVRFVFGVLRDNLALMNNLERIPIRAEDNYWGRSGFMLGAGFLALRVQVDVDVAEESGTQVRA